MTIRINDILKLLRIIKLYTKEHGASIQYVKQTYNDEPIKEARLPNYLEIENFCIELQLVEKNQVLKITKKGDEFFQLKNDFDKLSKMTIDLCLDSNYGDKIIQLIDEFNTNNENIKWHPKWIIFDLIETPEILPILYETGFLIKKELTVNLNPQYLENFTKILEKLPKTRKISQKKLENDLEIKKKVGSIGEKIAFDFEKNRLISSGFEKESQNVELISQEYANAGFDIRSFNGKNDNLEHDRLIEVKSSLREDFEFHWTINEIEIAKKLKEKYWIYFIPKIDLIEKTSSRDPIMIQNPFNEIFQSSNFVKKIEGYHIKKSNNDS